MRLRLPPAHGAWAAGAAQLDVAYSVTLRGCDPAARTPADAHAELRWRATPRRHGGRAAPSASSPQPLRACGGPCAGPAADGNAAGCKALDLQQQRVALQPVREHLHAAGDPLMWSALLDLGAFWAVIVRGHHQASLRAEAAVGGERRERPRRQVEREARDGHVGQRREVRRGDAAFDVRLPTRITRTP